jgi:gas vesicle protein
MSHETGPYIVIERRGGGTGAFIIGALAGAAVALLLAPRTGEETRAELLDGVQKLRDRAEDTVRNVQDAVSQTFDHVKGDVNDRIGAARDAFEAGRQTARDTREDMERRVKETRERVRAGLEAAKQPPATAGGDSSNGSELGV